MSDEEAWRAFGEALRTERYFEAHDILEEVWRVSHDRRQQAAIWVAAAFHHWGRGNAIGASKLLSKLLALEDVSPPVWRQCREWRDAVQCGADRPPIGGDAIEALLRWARR